MINKLIFFQVLLSHRYGTRCLPTRIIAKEYEILRTELLSLKESNEIDLSFKYTNKQNGTETENRTMTIDNLFEECYELDENEIPARYKLKFLENLFQNFNEKVIYYFL